MTRPRPRLTPVIAISFVISLFYSRAGCLRHSQAGQIAEIGSSGQLENTRYTSIILYTPSAMPETALDRFWELVSGAIALNPEAFELIQTLPLSTRVALYIVLSAGFSQALGQGIVLFINRVKPLRFVLSLLIAAILFAFGYIFWTISTWIVSNLLFRSNTSYLVVARTLALAYAPLMLSFFVALPYLGVPISVLLSVWSFLAFLTGLKVADGLGVWQAFWCSALGWVVFQVLQRTIGRPVAAIGRWIANTAAGVELVTDLKKLEQIVEIGVQRASGNNRKNQQSRRR